MFVPVNLYDGMPSRLYRSPEEIRRDMAKISSEIKEADEMLSVRSMLVEILSEWAEGNPEKWLAELEEVTEEARLSLERMTRLEGALRALREELDETRLAINL